MKRSLLSFAALFLLLSGCGGGGDSGGGGSGGGGGGGPETWTILLYLHGDNNLEPSVIADMEEMEQVGSSTGFNLVYQLDVKSISGVGRGLVANAPPAGIQTTAIQSLGEQNSDDPNVLRDFLIWGIQNYPADHYGVVLWDHGGQWKYTFGGNETTGGGSFMNVLQVRQALTGALSSTGVTKFDFLGFDTCLNGGAELVMQYGDLCNLYLACPEIDYGPGWNYAATLAYLKANPNATMAQFGSQEVSDWNAHHISSAIDIAFKCHAAYDMTQYSSFQTALTNFANAMNSALSSEYTLQVQARANATPYWHDPRSQTFPREFVDLGHFASLIAASSTVPTVQTAANGLLNVLSSLVIARSLGSQVSTSARALSIYLPIDTANPPTGTDLTNYASMAISGQTTWDAYLNSWLAALDGVAPGLTVTGTTNTTNPTVAMPATVSFTVTGSDTTALIGFYGQSVSGTLFNLFGHLFYQRGGPGPYVASWNGNALGLSDGVNTDFFCGFLVEPGSNLAYEFAIYDPPGSPPPIPVIVVANLSTSTIISVMDNSEAAPRAITPQVGGTIGAQFIQLNTSTGTSTLAASGFTVTIPASGIAGLNLFVGSVSSGSYRVIVGAQDFAGNSAFQAVTVTKP